MSRDLLSYCITDRASFKAVARAMMKRDGKWPKQIMVSRDAYHRIYNEKLQGTPNFTGLHLSCGEKALIACVVEGDNR